LIIHTYKKKSIYWSIALSTWYESDTKLPDINKIGARRKGSCSAYAIKKNLTGGDESKGRKRNQTKARHTYDSRHKAEVTLLPLADERRGGRRVATGRPRGRPSRRGEEGEADGRRRGG